MPNVSENISKSSSNGIGTTREIDSVREDQRTIEAVDALGGTIIPATPMQTDTSLQDRVTHNNANYIMKVRYLVALLLEQLKRIADKDRVRNEDLKVKYKTTSLEVATLQKTLGSQGFKFAMVAFGASFLQFLSPHESDRLIAGIFAKDVCPKVGEIFMSNTQGNMHQVKSISDLALAEFQGQQNNRGNEASRSQDLTNILTEAFRGLKDAARAG